MSGEGPARYRLVYSNQAQKDAKRLAQSGLKGKVLELLRLIEEDPYQSPPRFERLVGNLKGSISRRINIQHRLVYQVVEDERVVKVLRMWTHYE